MEHLTCEQDGSVAIMTWHHEEQNRFTTPFLNEILTALSELADNDAVTAVVVTSGHEKYFSTGLHLEWIVDQGSQDPSRLKEFLGALNGMLKLVTAFPKPLVAALSGHTIAAGCVTSACMDYRLMRKDKGLVGLPGVKIDIPFWPSMTAIFQQIMPAQAFRDMAYTGDRFTSQQAFEMGYVDQLCEADELLPAAVALARRLGANNPKTFEAIKLGMRERVIHAIDNENPKAIEQFVGKMLKAAGK